MAALRRGAEALSRGLGTEAGVLATAGATLTDQTSITMLKGLASSSSDNLSRLQRTYLMAPRPLELFQPLFSRPLSP